MSTHEPWVPTHGADSAFACFVKDHHTVVSDGTHIAVADLLPPDGAPSGRPTLLFASGWSCGDSYWHHMVPLLLDAGFRCIVPDTRGHGASGLPRKPGRGARNLRPADLSIKRFAADLLEVAADLDVDRAVVVGHSMGVQTALEAYRLDPHLVVGLVLVAGAYENPLRTFFGLPLADLGFPVMRTVMAYAPEVSWPVTASVGNARIGHFGARLVGAIGPKATPEGLHPYLLHLGEVDLAVMTRVAAAMRAHSAADLLGRIEVPVMVVAAGKDRFTPPRCSQELFKRTPTAEIHWFHDAGHTLPIEEPEEIAALIESFTARRL